MHDVCTPNIGPRERRKRLVVGLAMLAVTAVLGAILIATGTPRVWRLATIAPAWVAGVGLFQVRERTCVALAARGRRNLDGGDERITDPIELHRVRMQSRRVHLQAACFAAATAAFFVLLVPA